MPALTPIELLTPRLRLRWLSDADTDTHFAMFSDPEVVRYLGRPAWTERAQAERSVARTIADFASGAGLRLAVVLRATNRMIGDASLWRFDDANRRCEIGYSLARAHWGHGYAGEALHALLDYGFDVLDLNRIEADIDPLNTPSARALEKLGFRREGYLPERWIIDGQPADSALYGLLRSHWNARRGA